MIPKISVIIPTHNRAQMLTRSVESVLAQTWPGGMEILVISDGSTDNTEEVVESFDDPRVRLLKHETSQGASAARNTGISVAQGNYIAFLDDDDEWMKDHLKLLISKMNDAGSSVGLVYGWIDYYNDGKLVQQKHPELRGNIFIEMLDKQAITNSSVLLIRREVIDVVKGFDEKLPRGNDGDFIRRISKHFAVDYVPKVLAKIHIGHSDRISIDSPKNLRNVVFALESRLQTFKKDFQKHQTQKGQVLQILSITCFKIQDHSKGIHYAREILRCKISTWIKMRLLMRLSMGVMKQYLGKCLFSSLSHWKVKTFRAKL